MFSACCTQLWIKIRSDDACCSNPFFPLWLHHTVSRFWSFQGFQAEDPQMFKCSNAGNKNKQTNKKQLSKKYKSLWMDDQTNGSQITFPIGIHVMFLCSFPVYVYVQNHKSLLQFFDVNQIKVIRIVHNWMNLQLSFAPKQWVNHILNGSLS